MVLEHDLPPERPTTRTTTTRKGIDMTTPNYDIMGKILGLLNTITELPNGDLVSTTLAKIGGIFLGIHNGSPLDMSYYDLWRKLCWLRDELVSSGMFKDDAIDMAELAAALALLHLVPRDRLVVESHLMEDLV